MDDQDRYDRAKRRVAELKDFYSHLMVYLLVNGALFLVNMLTSADHLWFYWPLFFWGIGVVVHAFTVFGAGRFLGQQWEERKIKEFMDRDSGRSKE